MYQEPEWARSAEGFHLECIKEGTILGDLPIDKSCWVVGRQEGSELQLEHPSISRKHAVLQLGQPASEDCCKAYLYDLGQSVYVTVEIARLSLFAARPARTQRATLRATLVSCNDTCVQGPHTGLLSTRFRSSRKCFAN